MNDLTVGADVGGQRIATLQVQATSAIILDTLEDAGRYVYSRRWQVYIIVDGESVLVEWGSLTTVQQLAVVYQEWIYSMKKMAESYHTNDATRVARETAEAEIEAGRYDL